MGIGEIVVKEINETEFNIKSFPKATKVYKSKFKEQTNQKQEELKLEWINAPLTKDAEPTTRYDFNGKSIVGEFPVNSGLYHHNNQLNAGYSLENLKILVNSTNPSQRIIAMNIFQKTGILDIELILACRIALDSTNLSVIAGALNAISSFLKISNIYYDLPTHVSLEWVTNESINGNRIDEPTYGTTISEIKKVMENDLIMGLLLTNIIPRLNYLILNRMVDKKGKSQLHEILLAIAMHSPSSCEDIMQQNGLVDAILDQLEIIRYLMASSREACQSFIYNGILDIVAKKLPDCHAIKILEICINFGLAGGFIDEYYMILNSSCVYIGIWTEAIISFYEKLDIGGIDDMLVPIISRVLEYETDEKSKKYRLLRVYVDRGFKRVETSHSFDELVTRIFKFLPPIEELEVPEIINSPLINGPGLGFSQESNESVTAMIKVSKHCEEFGELLKLHQIINKHMGSRLLEAPTIQIPFIKLTGWNKIWLHGVYYLCATISELWENNANQSNLIKYLVFNAIPGDEYIVEKYVELHVPMYSKRIWGISVISDNQYINATNFFNTDLYAVGPGKSGILKYLNLLKAVETTDIKPFLNVFRDDELFLDDQISTYLGGILNTFVAENDPKKVVFEFKDMQNRFEELLNLYDSIGFGNELLLKYILLFCTKYNAIEYLELFWGQMLKQIQIVRIAADQVPWSMDCYLGQRNKKLLVCAKRTLSSGRIKDEGSFIFQLAVDIVSKS